MKLSAREIYHILECLGRVHGRGYSNDKEVGTLQAKLSIMLEVRAKMRDPLNPHIPLPEAKPHAP